MSENHFYCVFCGAGIDPDSSLDNRVCKCAKCLHFTPIPPSVARQQTHWVTLYPPDVFSVDVKFPCPECKERLAVDLRSAGERGVCPYCRKEIRCPSLPFSFEPAPGEAPIPKPEAPMKVIRLTREEIEFLNPGSPSMESHGKVAANAS